MDRLKSETDILSTPLLDDGHSTKNFCRAFGAALLLALAGCKKTPVQNAPANTFDAAASQNSDLSSHAIQKQTCSAVTIKIDPLPSRVMEREDWNTFFCAFVKSDCDLLIRSTDMKREGKGGGSIRDFSAIDFIGDEDFIHSLSEPQQDVLNYGPLRLAVPRAELSRFCLHGDIAEDATIGAQHRFVLPNAEAIVAKRDGVRVPVKGNFPLIGPWITIVGKK